MWQLAPARIFFVYETLCFVQNCKLLNIIFKFEFLGGVFCTKPRILADAGDDEKNIPVFHFCSSVKSGTGVDKFCLVGSLMGQDLIFSPQV